MSKLLNDQSLVLLHNNKTIKIIITANHIEARRACCDNKLFEILNSILLETKCKRCKTVFSVDISKINSYFEESCLFTFTIATNSKLAITYSY